MDNINIGGRYAATKRIAENRMGSDEFVNQPVLEMEYMLCRMFPELQYSFSRQLVMKT